jgi:hypothetical protein
VPDERAAWEPLWDGYLAVLQGNAWARCQRRRTWQRFHDPLEPMFLLGAYVDGS